jgi:hypothetical protein
MIPRADALPVACGILAGGTQAVGKRGEGWRPCAGIVAAHRRTRGKNLAGLAAAEASGAERAHELEVHFRTLESSNPGAGSFDARHGGNAGARD